jgi:hypothetical protein
MTVSAVDNRFFNGGSGIPDDVSHAYGVALHLDGATNNDPHVMVWGSGALGVSCGSQRGGWHYRYVMETLLMTWEFCNAVLLPEDKLLCQLGGDQICMVDLPNRRIVLLWHGRGPVPVIENNGQRDGAGVNGRN